MPRSSSGPRSAGSKTPRSRSLRRRRVPVRKRSQTWRCLSPARSTCSPEKHRRSQALHLVRRHGRRSVTRSASCLRPPGPLSTSRSGAPRCGLTVPMPRRLPGCNDCSVADLGFRPRARILRSRPHHRHRNARRRWCRPRESRPSQLVRSHRPRRSGACPSADSWVSASRSSFRRRRVLRVRTPRPTTVQPRPPSLSAGTRPARRPALVTRPRTRPRHPWGVAGQPGRQPRSRRPRHRLSARARRLPRRRLRPRRCHLPAP